MSTAADSAPTLVEWDAVLASVGGDEDFLAEVLGDLITEAAGVCEEIEAGFASADIAVITKAAHRIKGSASYLCCVALRDAAQALQYAGQQAKDEGALDSLRALFDTFKDVMSRTRSAIDRRKSGGMGEEAQASTALEAESVAPEASVPVGEVAAATCPDDTASDKAATTHEDGVVIANGDGLSGDASSSSSTA